MGESVTPPDHVYMKLRKFRTSSELHIQDVPLDRIVVDASVRRLLDEAAVEKLMESISELGLMSPISLRPEWDKTSVRLRLVTGHHRLAAYKRLFEAEPVMHEFESSRWAEIPAVIMTNVDDIDARLHEIAENLHRAELSGAERDEQIAEWVRLTAQKVGDASPTLGGAQPKEAGIRKAAADLGLDVKTVRKAVAIAGMDPEIKNASEAAGLTRAEMYQVARSEPQQQAAVVADLADAKATKLDTDIKNRAAEEMAEAIVEHMPTSLHGMMKENAWVCAKPLAIALTNLLGGAIMDKGAA